MADLINDVQIAPDAVINQLGDELGQLSVIIVQSKLKLAAALTELNRVNAENEGLRARVVARDADVAALREQVVAFQAKARKK